MSAVPDPLDLGVVPRLRGQLRRPPLPPGGAAPRGLVLGPGGGHGLAARVRAQGGDAPAGVAVLRGRRLREVSQRLLLISESMQDLLINVNAQKHREIGRVVKNLVHMN